MFLQAATVHESFSTIFTWIPLLYRMKHLMLPHILLSCELALTNITLEGLVGCIGAAHFVCQVKFQLVAKTGDKTTLAFTLERALGGTVMGFAQFVGSLESVSTSSARVSHYWAPFLCFHHLFLGIVLLLCVVF